MVRDREWFSEFPETDDEKVKAWLRNAGPFLSYNANVGFALCAEIKSREKQMKEMKPWVQAWSPMWFSALDDLKEIRGKEWERSK